MRSPTRKLLAPLSAVVMVSTPSDPSRAGEADVTNVVVRRAGADRFDFDVTIRSNDTGWDYYADKIEVLAPDGSVLGTRVLLHPHETEQPFTRDLYGVTISIGIDEVTVRAHHKPKGYDGAVMTVRLPQ